jgi:hypothetical protein
MRCPRFSQGLRHPDQMIFLRSIAGRLAVVLQIISLKSRTLGDVMSGGICIGNISHAKAAH